MIYLFIYYYYRRKSTLKTRNTRWTACQTTRYHKLQDPVLQLRYHDLPTISYNHQQSATTTPSQIRRSPTGPERPNLHHIVLHFKLYIQTILYNIYHVMMYKMSDLESQYIRYKLSILLSAFGFRYLGGGTGLTYKINNSVLPLRGGVFKCSISYL